MLFFVSSILQKKNPKKLQRRKANVQRQMDLWPALQEPSQTPEIWEPLNHQQKKDIITALANLISKMVCAEDINQTQEESHER